jgi:hypothetical protein
MEGVIEHVAKKFRDKKKTKKKEKKKKEQQHAASLHPRGKPRRGSNERVYLC